ncbi:unnamed protein product [Cercopithifilaria johnstoni]|uniref:Uncharacterized protein n=1 Tax=Cercopithifilaria johnstoni TaxID=2874296 RepID=A0A8J2MBV0_9BILA|nr:unnamed protein product [Cercopithifilaria johnstoni]
MRMIIFVCLIVTTIVWHGKCFSNIPLIPYNFKLYCRNGQSHIPETRVPSLCPSSSTSCGYFEFGNILLSGNKDEPLGFYECINSSILMPDNNNDDKIKQLLFSKYCDDQARCREIMLSSFDPKFVEYLIKSNDDRYLNERDDDKLQRLLTRRIKFCCAINDYLLQKIIHSGNSILPTLAPSEPVICNNVHCQGSPIGCLTYSESNQTQQLVEEEEDVVIVQPMHINYEDYTVISSQPINNKYMRKYTMEHHCVYRHFNDEMYRYCLLINDQPTNNNHCLYGDGYQLCCCFLQREFFLGARTCDPLSTEVITKKSMEISEIVPNQSITSLPTYNTNIKTKLRIRFSYMFKN